MLMDNSSQLITRPIVAEFPIPQGYYRSRLYLAPFSTNPLINAADPIFSLIERLAISTKLPPVTKLRADITHELNAFYSQLQLAEYNHDTIAMAHYLLCATLDELIAKSYIRTTNKAENFQAFTPLTADNARPEVRFFEIINYLKAHLHNHLDLMELAYYCLIAGFEGKYHLQASGRQTLDNLLEEVYNLIKEFRVIKPQPKIFTPQFRAKKTNYWPVIFLSLSVLVASFSLGKYYLQHKTNLIIANYFYE